MKGRTLGAAVRRELRVEFSSLEPGQALFSLEAARNVMRRAGVPELAELAITLWRAEVSLFLCGVFSLLFPHFFFF